MKSVVFFDVDGTLIKGNVNTTVIWHLYRMRLASSWLLARSAFWYLLWMVGLYGDLDEIARRGARELSGISRAQMDKALELIFKEHVQKKIFEEGRKLIGDHRRQGHHVVLLSSSFEPFIEKVARLLGLEEVIATKLALIGGVYTGGLADEVIGGRKHKVVEAYTKQFQPDEVYAYSDRYQDVPLLEMATHPVAVNPDMRLRRFARRRRWPILIFKRVPV